MNARRLAIFFSLVADAVLGGTALAQTPVSGQPALQNAVSADDAASIVAIVNGDVISRGDVNARRRLFALSSGMPASPEILDRLTPQVTRQLIDERLRLQEVQRRRIAVSDADIAAAIGEIESRNGMTAGALRARLSGQGVEFRTLVDQVRVQIGWTRVLREELGQRALVSDADIAEQERVLKAQTGQPEFRVSEIFVPTESPGAISAAQRFADTIIEQLRAGAPFAVIAAQFSQSQTALQGGDLGWVQPAEIDPAVLRVVEQMPVGAVSNPIRVPGGLSIVTLRGKRAIGQDVATMMKLRQAFFLFSSPLDPARPTEQQRQVLEQARKLSATATSCDAIEEANRAAGTGRPSDPGDVRLETISPALRSVVEKLPVGKPSGPLVAQDGIAVVMVCSKDTRNLGIPTRQELNERILGERIELASRQLMRDLQRRALVEERS